MEKPFKSIKNKNNYDADKIYVKAQNFETKGDYALAREYYYLAKDYDAIRFRAPEDLNDVIRELGKKYHVPVVPMKLVFESHSPNGIIGKNLVLEHLHPNVDGYFLMADAFFNVMRNEKLIANKWDTSLIKPSAYYRKNWGFTLLDSLLGDIKIKMIENGWPFKPEGFENNFLDTYIPNSTEDSVAFYYVRSTKDLEDGHINLAKYYATSGNYLKAFNEYYSLIKSNPYMKGLYLDAVKCLLAADESNKALELLISMPDKDSSFSALFQLGELYSKLKMPDKAIICYTQARKIIRPGDNLELLLTDLFFQYKLTGNLENERQMLIEIRAINPNFNPFKIEYKINEIENNEVKDLIIKAQKLLIQKNFEKALELLFKSLKIKETGLGNQMIGSVYFFKKDMKALIYYEKAYTEDPLDPDVLNNLFILYLMKNDIKNATKCLNEFQLVSTDNKKVQRLARYLKSAINKNSQKGY